MAEKKTKFFDLTQDITEAVVFPGDPVFKYEIVNSIENGSLYNLCCLQMGNHTGTHVDFPLHVIKNGKSSSDYPLESLIGTGLIIEVSEENEKITVDFVNKQGILKNDFVFFKTANSKIAENENFSSKFVYLDTESAESLVEMGVKVVGIDCLSVDSYEAEDLPVHKKLLSNEVLIVEGLKLNETPLGRCKIYILPIKIANMDGLPVRVVAEFKF
jgi:arylformamidase